MQHDVNYAAAREEEPQAGLVNRVATVNHLRREARQVDSYDEFGDYLSIMSCKKDDSIVFKGCDEHACFRRKVMRASG
ncbi:MAG: hypothetical protein RL499_1048, partial [Actinomycetota bacterium]